PPAAAPTFRLERLAEQAEKAMAHEMETGNAERRKDFIMECPRCPDPKPVAPDRGRGRLLELDSHHFFKAVLVETHGDEAAVIRGPLVLDLFGALDLLVDRGLQLRVRLDRFLDGDAAGQPQ